MSDDYTPEERSWIDQLENAYRECAWPAFSVLLSSALAREIDCVTRERDAVARILNSTGMAELVELAKRISGSSWDERKTWAVNALEVMKRQHNAIASAYSALGEMVHAPGRGWSDGEIEAFDKACVALKIGGAKGHEPKPGGPITFVRRYELSDWEREGDRWRREWSLHEMAALVYPDCEEFAWWAQTPTGHKTDGAAATEEEAKSAADAWLKTQAEASHG